LTAYDAGGGALGGDGGGGDDATVAGEGDGDAEAGHVLGSLCMQALHAAHAGLEASAGPLHVSAGQHAAHNLSLVPETGLGQVPDGVV